MSNDVNKPAEENSTRLSRLKAQSQGGYIEKTTKDGGQLSVNFLPDGTRIVNRSSADFNNRSQTIRFPDSQPERALEAHTSKNNEQELTVWTKKHEDREKEASTLERDVFMRR